MYLFILALQTALLFIMGAWYFGYRRAIRTGRDKLSSHGSGLLYGICATFIALVGLAMFDDSRKPDSQATTTGHQTAVAKIAAPVKAAPPAEAGEYHRLQLLATQMYWDKHFDVLEAALEKRKTDALKVIPALNGKSDVARVLKARGIRIGLNSDLSCLYLIKLANAPGCMLTVYITRRPNDRQTDLSGVPAHWFMGLNDTTFRPLPGWAEHIDQDDNWLKESGMLGYTDNR